jgi:hypothetical protein
MRTINYRRLARGNAYAELREQREREQRDREPREKQNKIPKGVPLGQQPRNSEAGVVELTSTQREKSLGRGLAVDVPLFRRLD